MEAITPVDWQSDAYWRTRRLSPAQLHIYDIEVKTAHSSPYPKLDINEVLPSSLLPDLRDRDRLSRVVHLRQLPAFGGELHRLRTLAGEYGWMNCLRINDEEHHDGETKNATQCRWM